MSSQPVESEPLWGPRRAPRWTVPGIVFLGTMAVANLFLAVRAAGERAWGETALYLGFVVVLGHVIGYGAYLGWRPARRGTVMPRTIRAGTSFRYSKWGYYWYVGLVVQAVLGLSLFAVLFLGHGIAGLLFAIVVLVLCLAAAFSAGLMLYLAPGHLTLTRNGVHHRSLSFTQYTPWSTVAGIFPFEAGAERSIVVDVLPDTGRIHHYLPKRLRSEHPLLPSIMVADTWLATDPVLVYETVQHYHANPGDRAELGTEAAFDRIRQHRWARSDQGLIEASESDDA